MMKTTLIALLLTLLAILTGCSDTKRLWDIFSSTREGPVTTYQKWDIKEPGRRLLLVMVHGFDSSNDQAWGEFPRIIKSEKDTVFSGFNVLRYGYGSAACHNKVDISGRGDGLKSFLSDELINYDGMIIVGHSLGGLVAMHGLIKLAKEHHADLERIPVAVMTFGTPHIGVQGAERLGEIGCLCTDKQAEAVTVFNRSLDELKVDWDSYFGNTALKYRVTIRTFYGSEDTFVSPASACGRFPGCEQIDGVNHVMIVKPSDTNLLTYKKLRVQVERMTDLVIGPILAQRLPPSSKEEQKRRPDDTATLLKTCGPSVSTKRPAAKFVLYWVSQVNRLREERNIHDHDLQNLMEVRAGGGIPRDAVGTDPFQEATFTLSCLERIGYLKMEKFDPPRVYVYDGKQIENQRIIFLKPMMTIPE